MNLDPLTLYAIKWFALGVLSTLAAQTWRRLQRRKAALIASGRRLFELQVKAESNGHAWNPRWGGVCSGCRKDLTLPGVATQLCIPVVDEPDHAV